MDSSASPRRRSRAARISERRAPLAEHLRPVRPGQESGRFKPLSDADIVKIHHAVLEVLNDIGLAQAIPSCQERIIAAGGHLNREGRLCFPPSLVEDTLAKYCGEFTLHAQDPNCDMHIGGQRVYFGSAGAAVHIVDVDQREYRESTLSDLYNIARLVDSLEHIHFFQRPVVARDMLDPRDLDINTLYAALCGTRKHIGTSFVEPEHVHEGLQMLHRVAGSEAAWRARPFVSQSNCFVVPPLRFAQDACRCLEVAVEGGMPVLLLSAGQAGATSPASLAGSVVQAVAECLAGVIYVNAIRPGAPFIFGTWPFVSDLRTGAMTGGSGEQAVLSAAVAQMGRFYNLPTGTAAGMTDAKLPNVQSGAEKGYALALAGHSGANLVYESAGMHASLLGACYESYVLDNDILGAVNRGIRGLEVTDESIDLDTIRATVTGPQHYLGSSQTMNLMQSHYLYPSVFDRFSPKEWQERGKPDPLVNAQTKVAEVLRQHYPQHIDPTLDQALRAQHQIHLPRTLMQGH